ncbi:hypothetical protein VTO58DRAFT_111554 [Aureobasidium pullulans]
MTEPCNVGCDFRRVSEDKETPIHEANVSIPGLEVYSCRLDQRGYALKATLGVNQYDIDPSPFLRAEERRLLLLHSLCAFENG